MDLTVAVRDLGDHWQVSCGPQTGSRAGPSRLLELGRRLCELDAVLGNVIAQGRTIERRIERDVNLPPTPSGADGVFRTAELVRPLLLSTSIKDPLYAYQRQGVAWLLTHKRALLADDMGLGKTLQAIAAFRRLIRHGRVGWGLVVAPRTLVANWVAEFNRWAPELAVREVLPVGRAREHTWRRTVRRAHVLVTSYEQFREPPEPLLSVPPDVVIADEAHRLRRREALATRGFRSISVDRLWALSGTPVERDAEDLAVVMSLVDPRRFSVADRELHTTELRARARPYVLRRSKSGVLSELPKVIEREECLELHGAQRKSYRLAISEHAKKGPSGSFLALFNRLRSICDIDPATGASCKLDRITEILGQIREDGEKAVVFSYLLEPIHELSRRLMGGGDGATVTISGEMALGEREEKIHRFRNELETSFLLASSRVASEGLTLTEANHVLFINRWWNPSSNLQARDRVVRIGQERPVFVYTFVCHGTVEDRLEEILRAKGATFDELVETLGRPADSSFRELFEENSL